MRVQFPTNLAIGTDIVSLQRFNRVTAPATYLHRMANRFLHPSELHVINNRFPGWQSPSQLPHAQHHKLVAHVAGRWAAKEAAKKAWGATLLSFKDLRVEVVDDGNVQIICQSYVDPREGGSAGDVVAATAWEQVAQLSISHDGDYAIATVLASPLHPGIVANLKARKMQAESKVAPP